MTLTEKLIRKIEIVTEDMKQDKKDGDFEQENYIGFVDKIKSVVRVMLSTQPAEYHRVMDLEDEYESLPDDTKELFRLVEANIKMKNEFYNIKS